MRNPTDIPDRHSASETSDRSARPTTVTRREFLARTTVAAAAFRISESWRAAAGPFEAVDFERLVPSDKKLTAAWVRSLTARGEPTVYHGAALPNIGMPVGGIGCGQLYLGGDGRLWLWDIFNQPPPPDFSDYRGPHYAKPLRPVAPIEQGFALAVGPAGGEIHRTLDSSGFRDVSFQGQYPVGCVEYRDPDCPVEVALEAFSPFIPLNVDESSLPLTVMEFTLRNTGTRAVDVALAGWIENATCLSSGKPGRGERVNTLRREEAFSLLDCRAHAAPPAPAPQPRPDLVFDDFERDAYGTWTATGTAFGKGPVEISKIPEYQGNVGAQGQRVVNTHASAPGGDVAARDSALGTLTSAPFVIERDFINFLIGGGSHKERTCLNLVIDDRTVLSATGESDNRMKPRSWDVRAWAGRTARLQVVDAEPGPWGNIGLDEIVFSDTPRPSILPLEQEEDFGSLALALIGSTSGDFGLKAMPEGALPRSAFAAGAGDLGPAGRRSVQSAENAVHTPFGKKITGSLGRRMKLRPGRSTKVTFLVAWHFPAVRRGSLSHVTGIAKLRRAYANRFASAADVARHGARHLERLAGGTRLWRQTWYDDSSLPHWFLERTFLNVSTLATATCLHFDSGRFYGWEGTYCCAGTCQHVWQYAHAVGRVFPALERSVREFVDYGLAFHSDTGAIDYRAEAHRVVAIDGQAGTILRVYREHQMSADDAFLRRLWPRVKKSVEHLLARDTDSDGILDGEQYNTLDASWYGRIAWLSSLYCAALRAGAAMAEEMGDTAFAARCTEVGNRGREQMERELFNGEYYIHRTDPAHADAINTNDGCHIDQVFGQSWAFQVGLPRVLPAASTRKALEALWRYSFTPDVGTYRDGFKAVPGGRWYAMPGEGGLLMCTWPKGGGDKAAGKGDATFVGYFNECMTGFEYQVAAHMIWEGLVQEGLAITRAIHDRYTAAKRNPFNEVECSSHYARAMASHGVYLAACGFEYHGPNGHLGFFPRTTSGEDFRCAFVAAEGWGMFRQAAVDGRRTAAIELRQGRLRLAKLALARTPGDADRDFKVRLGRKTLPSAIQRGEDRIEITLREPVILVAPAQLVVVRS